MADIWGNIGNVLGNFGTGVGQVLTGNFGGAWQTAQRNPFAPAPSSGGGGGGGGGGGWGTTPTTQTKTSSSQDAWAKESASLNAQLKALQNQLAAAPKLPTFDILGNYNRAKQTATAAVTPLYNQKLNLFLEGQGIKKETRTKQKDLSLENNDIALQNTLGDNTTSRTRTGEDLANALATIGNQRENFLTDDANQFDQARRALQEEIAAGGATDTGLGQQQIGQQQDQRNLQADRQTTEFKNQEAAKQLLANRTIDDLATSDDRSKVKKTQDDKAVNIDFEGYMKELVNEESSFRLSNDLDMALEIARQTQSNSQQGVAQFLAGLARQGWRPQDIALASQVYRM